MKLMENTKYRLHGEIAVYTGKFDCAYFNCYRCKRARLSVHEFLIFNSDNAADEYIKTGDNGLWSNNYHYGSECIKYADIRMG